MKSKTLKRNIVLVAAIAFVMINVVAVFHAYKFTHYTERDIDKTGNPAGLSVTEKLKAVVFGVNNPRPVNKTVPQASYETVKINSNVEIECWRIKVPESKGTVIMFHGFSSGKSSLIEKSDIINKLGFSTMLVDFMGSGGSEGNRTTIGFLESEQVKSCYDYLVSQGEKNVILFGTSMGSAAIMKSISESGYNPPGIIIECPFGTMYETVCSRFRTMHLPSFPMAGVLVFWGGLINGFWAFGHNPETYAENIKCPVLLMYGAKDDKVSIGEIQEIYSRLKGQKELKLFNDTGHDNYLETGRDEWEKTVSEFLKRREL